MGRKKYEISGDFRFMKIIPALLCHTQQEFFDKILVIETFTDFAQIDVMNNSLVAGETIWKPEDILASNTSLSFELHLMVNFPLILLQQFTEIKLIKRVYFHIESSDNPREVIACARNQSWKIGIVLNPETSIDTLQPYVDSIDSVMFMGVHPGASGRKFETNVIDKISQFHTQYPLQEIAADGGVSALTIPSLAKAGVTRCAVSSQIFEVNQTPQEAFEKLAYLAS